MPISPRRIARVSVLALMVGFAPVASAVGQSPDEVQAPAAEGQQRPQALSRAAAQAASEMAAPGSVDVLVKEAVQAQIDERENRRVAAIVEAQEKKLSPGKFVWQPELAPNGPMEIVVSLNAQRAYIFRKERLIGVTTVSTGRKGHETPTGSFPILQKKKMHFSNLYNDAPMPFMQRMNWDGIALHAGNIPGVPASHGCVRLPKEFSELLYQETRIGSIVHVVDELPGGAVTALAHARDEAVQSHAEAAARAVAKAARRAAGGGAQTRVR